jgi:PadR family transcriptional regulator, regulatory protein PadR
MSSPRPSVDLLQGTLDLLLLLSLTGGRRHGYEIVRWLHEHSGERLRIEEGALYPALHRLEAKGLIDAEWGSSANNRRAKFYRLTAAGRRRLDQQRQSWQRYADVVSRLLAAAG